MNDSVPTYMHNHFWCLKLRTVVFCTVFQNISESTYFVIKIVINRYLLSQEKDANFQKIYIHHIFDRVHHDIIEQLRMSPMSNEKKCLPTPTWTLNLYPILILQNLFCLITRHDVIRIYAVYNIRSTI